MKTPDNISYMFSKKVKINQDKKVVVSQLPLYVDINSKEKLIRADLPILQYRKIRAQLENSESLHEIKK